jgi:hypothetical protein
MMRFAALICTWAVAALTLLARLDAQAPGPPFVEATLTVRLTADRSDYKIGEVIPLELVFSGRGEPDLYFSTENYDRSGRMETEQYAVTPEDGADDPLADYFSASAGRIGGGLRGWHRLDGTPFRLRVNLNDWIRFTRPGRYQISIVSRRLHRYSNRPAPELKSDPLTLEIADAPAAWASEQVAIARGAIDQGVDDLTRDRVTLLRHLGTREAALALVDLHDRLAGRFGFDVVAGLAASPFRRDIVAAMEERVDAGVPLPPSYLRDVTLLRSLLEAPSGTGDPAARFERSRSIESDYRTRWLMALLRRPPSTGALRAAFEAVAVTSDPGFEATVARALRERPELAAEAFLALPPSVQQTLLHSHWTALEGPWRESATLRLYDSWKGDYRFSGAGDLALTRLQEIAPIQGRALLLEEIRTGRHGLAYETLSRIPDNERRDLDDALRMRFERATSGDDRATTVWLMAKYGSRALVPVVKAEIERGVMCSIEAGALAYLLKHDPQSAVRRLQPEFDRAGGCVVVPWQEVAARFWDDHLEHAALAHARSTVPRHASEAIQILGRYGSVAAKQPLIERLTDWEKEWRGRASELEGPPLESGAIIENALVNALLQNKTFALSAADLARVRTSCVTDSCRKNVDAQLKRRQ